MKFMKLGSKPDIFQADGKDVRFVASDLASDIIITVGDIKFYLHKFPLMSKSAHLQKLVTNNNLETGDEIQISEIPGGASAFEICAKFCYGMTVTLSAHNVIPARCAAEYLGIHETVEKRNLIYKIDVFLNSTIFHSWKDSIIVLQTTSNLMLLPLAEDIKKIVSHCIESIARKVCLEDESTSHVPKDRWVEDLCELEVDLYKSVMTNIINKKILSSEAIGEALKAYTNRRLPKIYHWNVSKHRLIAETIVRLLPSEKGSVSCRFLLKLLKAAIFIDLGDVTKEELVRRIGRQLEEASVSDILLQAHEGDEAIMFDVNVVQRIVREFLTQDQNDEIELARSGGLKEMTRPRILSDASKLMVAKLVDGYLAEISKDPNLPLSKFVDLAELVSGIPRPTHDGLYSAIDMYLKDHPGISKGERNRICKLMDCKKLSIDACTHAVQNERLPIRVVVQVLHYERLRTSRTSGTESESATSRLELASLSLNREKDGDDDDDDKPNSDKVVMSKMRGLFKSQRSFIKQWASKMGVLENNSSSDSSESNGSAIPKAAKSTPSRKWRHSVS